MSNLNYSNDERTRHRRKKYRKKNKLKRIILFSVLGVILVAGACVFLYFNQALNDPGSLFNHTSVNNYTDKPMDPDINGDSDSPSANSTPKPPSLTGDHVVNVLLLGLDLNYKTYATDGHGGNYHTDSIVVVNINKDKNKVTLISLPRDTLTHVPGVRGIYKLNAAINCGGGKTDAGFKKVCDAASALLGGVNIDYYYAFELDTVKEVGDMIGGVDFNVEMEYDGSSGKHYKKGMQHLDGTGIYDYMRARDNSTTGDKTDKGRMSRGRAILQAVFQKLKSQNMLTQIPGLLYNLNKGLYTNMPLMSSIYLANYAKTINIDDISSFTMPGNEGKDTMALGWRWYFVDQQGRKNLIKQVFGIDVPEQQCVSMDYANWLGDHGFKATRYLATAFDLVQYIKNKGTGTLNSNQTDMYNSLTADYKKVQAAYDAAALSLSKDDSNTMEDAMTDLRNDTLKLADSINYPNNMKWTVNTNQEWCNDPCINEITVNFQ